MADPPILIDEEVLPTLEAPEEEQSGDAAVAPNDRAERAQRAARTAALEAQVQSLESALSEARGALEGSERRRLIDLALIEAGAIDLEAARVLVEHALAQMETPDVDQAVRETRARRAYLFRGAARSGVSAMSGRAREPSIGALEEAAEEAVSSGDVQALLRYLRIRRGA